MPYRDEAGVKHVLATDPISDGSRLHLLECALCQERFPNNARQLKEFEMATKEVLQSTCDRCGNEESVEVDKVVGKTRKGVKILLPTGWLHVVANSAFVHNAIAMDLCGQCSAELTNWVFPVEAREGE